MEGAFAVRFAGGAARGLDAVIRPESVECQRAGEELGVRRGLEQFARVVLIQPFASVERNDFRAPGRGREARSRNVGGDSGLQFCKVSCRPGRVRR